jgi:tetratricopeptide (TPR) repeat protein
MTAQLLAFVFALVLAHLTATAQETVFSILKKQSRLAQDYYQGKNYKAALAIYTRLYAKDSSSKVWPVKMGKRAYFLKEYNKVVSAYSRLKPSELPLEDLYNLAESLVSIDRYKRALSCYQVCLEKSPGNQLITQKIWRLNNIRYLYEDSLHYAVRALPLNTASGEFGVAPFNQGVVFISNRKQVQVVEKMDAALQQPFYSAYYAPAFADSSGSTLARYRKPVLFAKTLFTGLHAGSMAFYGRGTKMAFVSSSEHNGMRGERALQLFFAEIRNSQWKRTGTFPYNSNDYSITDPSVNEDGTVLYFASNMPGGFGGKDIYRSRLLNGQWSKPENLGEVVNTSYDEVAPYLHLDKVLYFSSNGHAGLGGLDIFKASIASGTEVENMGYPINSASDEFGIIIDSLCTHGYFSSNRKNGGYDDDLYEFDMDLQTYPLTLTGTMRYKESTLSDSTDLKPFAQARYYLIDNLRDVVVQEGTADDQGNFSWNVPYFSKYRVRVIGPDNDEHIVSLEIPKHRKSQSNHEIVIVKDVFR